MRFLGSSSLVATTLILAISLYREVSGAFCPSDQRANAVCGSTEKQSGTITKARGPEVDKKKNTDFFCKDETFDTPICCSKPSTQVKDFKTQCGGAPQGVKKGFVKKPITNQ
ncbi:hypothetical protein MJO28_006870 [Puccinia striiformis f. sp. tritici]|uniref:Secreted protein n=3 Tax=Puccinia striiformis TaxID=27350 RepID=A0A0L0VJ07_9BASI|nr:hypothetical protein Pst134EA_013002 [Puccinia striiformis f. sp. tritici]KAI9622035.1 hypothetical protein H4Q26_015473 [Puccinia striiformis f. sp. tritici PST-130]KNE99270.1 hypothetical protein PSTG_07384 [Puccinia striiformis f. sp. tritici PST-78]POW17400.1 hypothetical protein PSHT_06414 [Puccinia striiformis]KAH9465106.1 hypothetical protein Pst134EA_013002 [Puccinia striiformis f. sp. tritici]KAI7951186.1 hypothetical protein MJO28_006870 [Puccinia striiformis f. sp. tritici]